MQRQGGVVIGGSTYEIRLKRARGLHPVSKIRIILEKVQLTRDDIMYMKKEKNRAFIGCIRFNDDICNEQYMRIPKKGYIGIRNLQKNRTHEFNLCLFNGYVSEYSNFTLIIYEIKNDFSYDEDKIIYLRHFNGPPETWIGHYTSNEYSVNHRTKQQTWIFNYRIESKRIS